MTTWEFRRWSSRIQTVTAHRVEFTNAGDLVFRNKEGRLILAVKHEDWNDLKEIEIE